MKYFQMFSTQGREKINLALMFTCVYVCVRVWAHMLVVIAEGWPYSISLGVMVFMVARVTLCSSLKCFKYDNLVVNYLNTLEVGQESIRYLFVQLHYKICCHTQPIRKS